MRVVERVGGKEDVPVLIEYLQEKGHNVEYVGDSYQPGVRATEEAIYKCLEKLTGTKNPATSRAGLRGVLAEVVGRERQENRRR